MLEKNVVGLFKILQWCFKGFCILYFVTLDVYYSELNDLLHNSVGAPSSTQKHQASAHSGDSRQAAAQKWSASSNVRLQSSAVTEEGVPRAGTGRVKDVSLC